MNRSKHFAEIATTQYETAVLEAYGVIPIKENVPSFCHSSVHWTLIRSMLQLNDIRLVREEDHMNGHETQTSEQRQNLAKLTKNDVLKAHGII